MESSRGFLARHRIGNILYRTDWLLGPSPRILQVQRMIFRGTIFRKLIAYDAYFSYYSILSSRMIRSS